MTTHQPEGITMMRKEAIGAVVIFAVVFGVAAIFNATSDDGVGGTGWLFALLIAVAITVVSVIAARQRVRQ